MNAKEIVEKAFVAGAEWQKMDHQPTSTTGAIERVCNNLILPEMGFKKITEEYDFQQAVEPVMDWISKHGHPHMKVIIQDIKAEIVSGEYVHKTDAFIRD